MCGIVGYVGEEEASGIVLECLKKLEYRGYDSAGIATLNEKISFLKNKGAIGDVFSKKNVVKLRGKIGVGHTRWATHGEPSKKNAHPHWDCSKKFFVVHNGIIENYLELKESLIRKGHVFSSETDTEVVAHLLEEYSKKLGFEEAFKKTLGVLSGSYALLVLTTLRPGRIFFARRFSPLLAGVGDKEFFLASDVPAFLSKTKKVVYLFDGEWGWISSDGLFVFDEDGKRVNRKPSAVSWTQEMAEKRGHRYFMIKEIREQAFALTETLRVSEKELLSVARLLKNSDKVYLTACGSSYHAALVGKYVFEELCGLPVEVVYSHEFRFSAKKLVKPKTLVLAISQSGETADTLAAVRKAKEAGASVVSVVNVVGSSLTRLSDVVLYTRAGPEIAVVATKSFTTQLLLLYMVAVSLASLEKQNTSRLKRELLSIPKKVSETIFLNDGKAKKLADRLFKKEDFYFIGRGQGWPIALEGALKLKEISYIHGEGFAGAELKHGTMSLLEKGVPVVAVLLKDERYEKTLSSLEEVKSRKAMVLAVAEEGDRKAGKLCEEVFYVKDAGVFSAIALVVPLQLLAYYTAVRRGYDPDKPRNLAKSVTVE